MEEGRRVALFFSNSNLDSQEEFQRRLEALRQVAGHFGLGEVLVDPYRPDLWTRFVSRLCPDYASQPERGSGAANASGGASPARRRPPPAEAGPSPPPSP